MADRDRLRALEVRVAGHRRLGLDLRPLEDRAGERGDARIRLHASVGDVEPERRRDLVVPRPAGVDLAADLAELPLDRAVDVLVAGVDGSLARDPGERLFRRDELGIAQQSGRMQPPRVDERRAAVVRQELRVVAPQEVSNLRRERRRHPPRPERHAGVAAGLRSRAAASSVSSAEMRTNPEAASCGNVSPVAYDARCSA